MSQTRRRPTTGPGDDSKSTSGLRVGPGGRSTMGFILLILCAIFHISIGCSTETGRLHDIERRTMSYKSVIGEPLVTDYKIKERWYSLDQYRIVQGVRNLTAGSCGTGYQIVIKEGTTIDWDSLDENSVTLTAMVYGRPYGHGEDLEIRVRKCDEGLQYYLKSPSIRLAAYCFDSMETDPVTDEEGPLTVPSSIYLSLQDSLTFREELRGGQLYDIPYVSWNCTVEGYSREDILPEFQFITFTWFSDNIRIKSSGPQSVSIGTSYRYLASSNLTEDEFLDAGSSIGAMIRCGAQFSQSTLGKLSHMITTSYDTNLQFRLSENQMSDNIDRYELNIYNPVPIGCLAPVGSVEKSCTLKLSVIRDDGTLACSEGPTVADEHELCGITLFGKMKNGTYDHYRRYRNYRNENGTYITETDRTYILTENMMEDAERPSKFQLSVAVLDNTVGHAMWDSVNVQNAKVDLQGLQDHRYVDVYEYYLTVGQRAENPNVDVHFLHLYNDYWLLNEPIEEPGKYIMLWSRKFPFTLEVEIESSIDGNLTLCGVYLRYGNDIYTYSVCGGVFIQGLIFGDGNYISDTVGTDVPLQEVRLQMRANLYNGQLSINLNNDYTDGFEYDSFEGIGSIGAMVGRHGTVYTKDSTGFLRSWRIDESESLSNPDNYIYYSLETKYTTCVCPTKTDDIPEKEITYASDYHIDYNVYTGALACNLDDGCSDITVGEGCRKF